MSAGTEPRAVSSNASADDTLTIYERSKPGRRAFTAPALDVPERPLEELLPAALRRAQGPRLPEVAEPEIVRHYNRLSKRNFDLDTGFYPLGSCTMKHNPKLHERLAALPGHAKLHPLQHPTRAQGALELMWRLQYALGEISGLPHVSLQPSAGSHGELAGVLLTRAYHEDRGEHRTKVLTPDTAHGTNPATVTMAGYDVVKIGTDPDGNVDIDDLRAKADTDVACLMLTNPSTLGLFEPQIEEIARIVHAVGATLYYDGANLNAIMGICRPGDMGFDIVHFNLHKSFTQPHGGGGPGAGPIAVSERIEPYLPRPQVVRRAPENGGGPTYELDLDRPKSIGRLRGFQGNYGVFVRSYAYIRSLGAAGLKDVSETAVLNANYLLARLRELGVLESLPAAYERLCMHEFVLSGAPMKRELEIRTLDLAKRLLDHGVHPPTVYFPLLVDEALLVEPTETETKETLDHFAQIVADVLSEAREDPAIARGAPYTTPVRRLDEARAARRPVIRQPLSTRYVVFGAGAIGGVVGARLHQAGCEVALIARGAHLKAIRARGLRLLTPVEDTTLELPVAADPAELEVGREGDVVLLCVKSQDTLGALDGLRAAGAAELPIVCLQNGVENERAALRRFPEVYGGLVLAPTNHLEAGIVEASGSKLSGFIDIGRYPTGADARCEALAQALSGARFHSRAVEDVMRLKYAKLLLNLGNVVGALFAEGPARDELITRVRDEGELVLDVSEIDHHDPDVSDREQRWLDLGVAPIAGRPRGGSSSWQSLARGTRAIETDYLNGEISLLGRLHGVRTPLNDALCRLADAHARRGGDPEALAADAVLARAA